MAAGFRKRDLHAPDKAVSNSVVPVSGAAMFRANEGQVAVFRFRGELVAGRALGGHCLSCCWRGIDTDA